MCAQALCLELRATAVEEAMALRIDRTLASLQAASPTELRRLRADYRRAQTAWRRNVTTRCRDLTRGNAVREQLCRLATARSRAATTMPKPPTVRRKKSGRPR